MIWAGREVVDVYYGGERISEIYMGDLLVWKEWQFPVEDSEILTLYQVYDITEYGDILEVY